jgi:hypothetical protein
MRTALYQDAGIPQKLTVKEHTHFVIEAARRYQLAQGIPYIHQDGIPLFGPREFLLLLMTHDLNKTPYKDSTKDRAAEHLRTVSLLTQENHRSGLTVTKQQLTILCAFIEQDIFGDFFTAHVPGRFMIAKRIALYESYRHGCPESTERFMATHTQIVSAISDMGVELQQDAKRSFLDALAALADKTEIPPQQAFEILLRFFVADTLAYTREAVHQNKCGGPWLDFLYELNQPGLTPTTFQVVPNESRVRFSPTYEKLYNELRRSIE